MDIEAPAQFGVRADGKKVDLRASLKPQQYTDITGKKRNGFQASYGIKKPGDHIFYVEPQPYREAAEAVLIVHNTKQTTTTRNTTIFKRVTETRNTTNTTNMSSHIPIGRRPKRSLSSITPR